MNLNEAERELLREALAALRCDAKGTADYHERTREQYFHNPDHRLHQRFLNKTRDATNKATAISVLMAKLGI
jgi:hypothetical protein